MNVPFRACRLRTPLALAATAAVLLAAPATASPYSDINDMATTAEIKVHALRGGVSMLEGSGGNIGVLVTPEGAFLADTGISLSQAKIEAALRGLSAGPIRYAANTHWHWDHADGNAWVRKTGATIIASRNTVRHLDDTIRVVEWEHTFTPIPPADQPNEAIDREKIVTLGGERVRIRPYTGHTDGDLSIYFENADVLVTGDTFWNDCYPFIDYVAGGGIDGMIRQAEANIALAGARTRIIPGHGPVAGRADIEAFRHMLVAVRARVAALKAEGKSLEEVQATRPTTDFDGRWGRSLISPQLFTALVYRGV